MAEFISVTNRSTLTFGGNSTEQELSELMQQADYILPVLINAILLSVTTWILLSLIHYGLKTGKWRASQRSYSDKLSSGVIYAFVLVCALSCVICYSVSLAFMNVGFEEGHDFTCDSLADAIFCSYGFVHFSTAFFLWSRQRAFYSNHMLNVNYNKIIRFFSFFSIIVIIIYGLAVMLFSVIPSLYYSSPMGCLVQQSRLTDPRYSVPLIVGVAFYNMVLLGLLAYALTHIRMFQKALGTNRDKERTSSEGGKNKKIDSFKKNHSISLSGIETNNVSAVGTSNCSGIAKSAETEKQNAWRTETSSLSRSARFTMRSKSKKENASTEKTRTVIQKTVIFAALSIFLDAFTSVCSIYLVNPDGHRRISFLVLDLNTFLHLLFLIFSFVRYKHMLTSPLAQYF